MEKGRAYHRRQRARVINRKFDIRRCILGKLMADEYYENNPKGALSKGKIHCSCGMCQRKSNRELTHRDKSKFMLDLVFIEEYYLNE